MRKPRLLIAVAGALLAFAALAGPVRAHQGGKVQLFLKDLKVERAEGGYDVTAILVDRDSGAVATGYATTLEGRSADGESFPASAMTAGSGGVYTLSLPTAPGDWTVTLRAVAVPGTEDAIPLVDQKRITFPAHGASEVVSDGGGGSGSGAVLALVVVVALAGLGGAVFARRRRPHPAL